MQSLPIKKIREFSQWGEIIENTRKEKNEIDGKEVEVNRALTDADREDITIYKAVVNHKDQYFIWLAYKEIPLGWKDTGKSGLK